MSPRLVAFVALLFLAANAVAQQTPVGQKGFAPDKLYQFGDIDNVNIFNGNVIITIPFGLRFPLDGGLSYGLTLTNNSKVWSLDSGGGHTVSFPSRRSNSGMGWLLSMGRLVPPEDPANDTDTSWIYEGPDGADHVFAASQLYLGEACNDPKCGVTLYTHDESYLRMQEISSTLREVQSADGVVRRFQKFGTEWRLTRISNAFLDTSGQPNNSVNVDYPAQVAQCPGAALVWRIADSKSRTSYVCLKNANYGGSTRPMVDRVVMTAFAGTTATWLFNYGANQTISRSCEDTEATSPETGPPYSVPLLRSLTQPDGSTFEMTYWLQEGCNGGVVKQLTLPTKASINYTFDLWGIPSMTDQCHYSIQGEGVTTRTMKDALGNVVGQPWIYAQQLTGRNAPGYVSGINCGTEQLPVFPLLFDESTTTVIDPAGDRTVSHFTVWPGNAGTLYDDESPSGFRYQHYSLPYGAYDPATNLYLTTEVYDCAPGGGNCGTPVRSTYLRQRIDPPANRAGDPFTHVTTEATRTVYRDDPAGCIPSGVNANCRFAQADLTGFDGYGHFRTETTSGNFDGTNARTTFTNFNPGASAQGRDGTGALLIRPSLPWILGTFDERRTTVGSDETIEQDCVDSATGFLRARRTLVNLPISPGLNVKDFLTVFEPELRPDGSWSGNTAAEKSYGGDHQPLSTSANVPICQAATMANPGPLGYRIDHTYQNGVLAKSKYNGTSFFSLDQTIDSTGLVASSRDTASFETTYLYDSASRLTRVSPPGDAPTIYTYSNDAVSGGVFTPASVESATTSTQGYGAIRKQYEFNAFGRLRREESLMRDGSWSVVETLYDEPIGRKISVSEPALSPVNLTTFSGYDPFGRAGTITAPDGTTTQLTYTGVSKTKRTVGIAIAGALDTPVDTTETYDRHGRLLSVTEAAETPLAVTTLYGYDLADRLTAVSMTRESGTQLRFFTYDHRGLLTSEQHPELGAAGNGSITYSDFDARGHALRKTTGSVNGPFDLRFELDAAERVTFVRSASGSILKQFQYDILDSCDPSECEGKLVATVRYNDFGSELRNIAAVQTFQYKAPGGRISRRDYAVGSSLPALFAGADFNHGQTWNDLGEVATTAYPCRSQAPDCLPEDRPRPVVAYGRTNGFLTSVGDWAGNITYHSNGMIDTVTHSDGGTTVVLREVLVPDSSGMRRPRQIVATNGNGGEVWSTGDYAYDAAGNIKQIGPTSYRYDPFSRLVSWTKSTPSGFSTTQRAYDGFGNFLYEAYQSCGSSFSNLFCSYSSILPREVQTTSNRYTLSTYDEAGNETVSRGRLFGWDALGMLKSASVSGRAFRYVYDANDERVAVVEIKNIGGQPRNRTTWSVRDLDNRLLTTWTDDATSGQRVFTWKEDEIWRGSSLLGNDSPTGRKHYALDHLGSPRLIHYNGTDSTQDFDPFGSGGLLGSGSLQFTGQEADAVAVGDGNTDLPYYMHARFYEAAAGRFLSIDPTWESADIGSPQSWNRYAYVRNNPVNLTDPDGRNPAAGVLTRIIVRYAIREAGRAAVRTTADLGARYVAQRTSDYAHPVVVPAALAEGIYEFPDAGEPDKTYVGQSEDTDRRIKEHEASGKKDPESEAAVIEVPGGKTAREHAEQNRINEFGGKSSVPGSQTTNKVNPIGPKRRPTVEEVYGPIKPPRPKVIPDIPEKP